MVKIKICGLTRLCDIEAVNEAIPDYVGFVFADSKRRITPKEAFGLKEHLNDKIQTVGVFVDETIEQIVDICSKGIIDVIQLHGHENPAYIKRLRKESGKLVIKAIRVRSREDITAADTLPSNYLLLDAYSNESSGGTGKTFDWNVIDGVKNPFFLAGGLNRDNILQAIEVVKPFGVDLSSGVETDGFKDRDKIIDIVKSVRSTREVY